MLFVKQVFVDNYADIIVGIAMMVFGLIIPTFKKYWLIAGVNTASPKELDKIDLKYFGKYFGIAFAVFGFILTLNPFVCSYFGLNKYLFFFQLGIILLLVVFLIAFGHLKKDKIYKRGSRL